MEKENANVYTHKISLALTFDFSNLTISAVKLNCFFWFISNLVRKFWKKNNNTNRRGHTHISALFNTVPITWLWKSRCITFEWSCLCASLWMCGSNPQSHLCPTSPASHLEGRQDQASHRTPDQRASDRSVKALWTSTVTQADTVVCALAQTHTVSKAITPPSAFAGMHKHTTSNTLWF